MAIAAWHFVRAWASIHIDHAVGVGASNVDDEQPFLIRNLDEVYAVRSLKLTGGTGGMTSCVGFQFVDLPILI